LRLWKNFKIQVLQSGVRTCLGERLTDHSPCTELKVSALPRRASKHNTRSPVVAGAIPRKRFSHGVAKQPIRIFYQKVMYP